MIIRSYITKFLKQGALLGALFLLGFGATLLAPRHTQAVSECAWVSDALITCGEGEFWFDTDLSAAQAKPIYRLRTNINKELQSNNDWKDWWLFVGSDGRSFTTSQKPEVDPNSAKGDLRDTPKRNDRSYAKGDDPNITERASANDPKIQDGYYGDSFNGAKQHFFCGILSRAGNQCWSGAGGVIKTIDEATGAKLTKMSEDIDAAIAANSDCTDDAGAIGFVLCPLMDVTNNAVNSLIGGDGSGQGFLVELLTIQPLSSASGNKLYAAWEGIRNIALGLYTIVFLLIVFGNGLGYDPYTIKRAMPRLAVGVLLTFASFFIVQTLVDLSNIIGNAIPAFIAQISGQTGVATYSLQMNYAAGAISIMLWIVLLFVALGALLVGIAGLIMRVVIIYGLVLLAPIAFVAWVLPNTENLYKKWWQNLIKVLMMFPIVTGMLALAIFFQEVILASAPSGSISESTAQVVAAVAPLIALILIPKTFKWGGAAFAAAAGYTAGKMSGWKDRGAGAAKGFGKDSAERTRNRAVAGMLERSKSNAALASDRDKADNAKGARRASLAGKAQRAMGLAISGKMPTKRGLVAAGVRAGKATSEQAEMEETAAQYYSRGELKSQMARSGAKLAKNPNNAIEMARYRGLQKQAIKSRDRDSLKAGKDAFNVSDSARDAYTKIAGPNLGDLSDSFGDMGSFDKSNYFNPQGMSAEKIASQHKSTLEAWTKDDSFIRMSSDQIKALKDPRLRQKMSAEQQQFVDTGIRQWEQGYGPPRPSGSSGSTPGPTTPPPAAPGPTTPPMPGPPAPGPMTPPPAPAPGTPPPYTGPPPAWQSAPSAPPPAAPPPPAPAPSAPPSAPAAPTTRPGSPVRGMAGNAMSPGAPVSPSGGSTSSPSGGAASSGGPTTIVNNTSVSQVFQQSGSLRTQMAAGGGLDGYNDIMRKMDNIDAKLARGTVDTGTLKKDLKSLRLARSAAPENMHGQFDEYMRGVEESAGLPQNAGDHDVDIDGVE